MNRKKLGPETEIKNITIRVGQTDPATSALLPSYQKRLQTEKLFFKKKTYVVKLFHALNYELIVHHMSFLVLQWF